MGRKLTRRGDTVVTIYAGACDSVVINPHIRPVTRQRGSVATATGAGRGNVVGRFSGRGGIVMACCTCT